MRGGRGARWLQAKVGHPVFLARLPRFARAPPAMDILRQVSEAPIVIENRKELTYLLSEAAELEHGLMCEYLYAAFSLKREAGPGVSDSQLESVERWRRVLLDVAAQEMLHWALVNNILTAVGSAPYVSRPHLPHQAKGYPAGVQVALVPFGERALRHFLFLERPEGMELADAEGFDPRGPALPIMSDVTSFPGARSSPQSATCTAPSKPASPAWPKSTVRTGSSSDRRRPRPPRSGRSCWPSSTWPPPAGPSSSSWSRARGLAATGARLTTVASSPCSTSIGRCVRPIPPSIPLTL